MAPSDMPYRNVVSALITQVMGVGDCVTLVAALMALVLAAYSAISIRLIRGRLHRQTLLSELAEWATDLTLCAGILDEAYIARKLGERSRAAGLQAKWSTEIELLKTRIKYIQEASSGLGHGLGEDFAKVRESLDRYQELVSGQLGGKTSDEKVLKELTALNLGVRRLLHEISQAVR